MSQVQIEKLTSTNYASWVIDVKYLLLERNLWRIVTGEETKPPDTEKQQLRDFEVRSNQAQALIYLNVSAELKPIIASCESPNEVWTKLYKNHCPDSRANHMRLFTNFLDGKIKEGETIVLFASRLQILFNNLKSIDQQFDENYLNFQLLRYLPRKFDSIVQSILRWKSADFTFNKIVDELNAEETRLKLRDCDSSRLMRPLLNQTEVRPRKRRCWSCGSPSHLQRNCRWNLPGARAASANRQWSRREEGSDRSYRASSNEPQRSRLPSAERRASSSRSRRSQSSSAERRDSSGRSTSNRSRRPDRTSRRKVSSTSSPYGADYRHDYEGFEHSSSCKSFYVHVPSCNLTSNESDGWILDTGATHHFCGDKSLFSNYEIVNDKSLTIAIKNVSFPIEGRGDVKLLFGQRLITLKNVMYSSELKRNLISGPQLDREGACFCGSRGKVTISKDNSVLFFAFLIDGVYQVFPKVPKSNQRHVTFANAAMSLESLNEWHRKFGHISPSILEHTARNAGVKGLPKLSFNKFECEVCKINKHRKVSFKPIDQIRSSKPLELLLMDIWGPAQTEGRNAERYFLTIIDDYSRRVSLYPLRLRSDAYEVITNHITNAETFLGLKVKCVRSDNGGEFVSDDLESFFRSKGIKHELTNVYTPAQNGIAERFMQTVVDGARTLLAESKLSVQFWPEAMKYFVYSWNRICPKRLNKTPFELYGGRKPSIKHLKPFGTLAYVGIPKPRRQGKLGPKARKGYLVGYAFRTKGYRIWVPEIDKIIESIDVTFSKRRDGSPDRSRAVLGPEITDLFPMQTRPSEEDTVEVEPEAVRPGPSSERRESESDEGETDEPGSSSEDELPSPPLREAKWRRCPVRRKTGTRTDIYYYEEGQNKRLRSLYDVEKYCKLHNIKFRPNLFNFTSRDLYSGPVSIPSSNSESSSEDEETISSNLIDSVIVPRTYKQAIKSPQSDKWQEAMETEMDIMEKRKVWHLERLPSGVTPVGCRWVYTVKYDENGKIARYKARLVAQGFKQVKGESYDLTFSPVVNFGIIRMLFAILVAHYRWYHVQCDVASAYLYASLKENVYMSQPPGFSVPEKEQFYCKLDRAIYGLHQSGREWFYEVHDVLINLGFNRITACNCVYTFYPKIVLLLYVDDMVIFGKHNRDVQHVLNLLQSKFDLKILGRTRKLLGVEFKETNNQLEIFQAQYIDEITERFNKFVIPISSLPISKGTTYSKMDCPDTEQEITAMSKFPYRSVLGCLSFIANRTRPDISYAVNIFSQFQANPGLPHWEGLLRLLGYVKHTRHYRLRLKCNLGNVIAYSDSDYAANRDDRISLGGNLILIDSAPVEWRTFKEKCVSLSTMESEFYSMAETAKSLIWFKRVLLECVQKRVMDDAKKYPVLFMDNQAAIDFVKSPIENHRSKHIDVRLHFVRDLVYKEEFQIQYVKSSANLADVFTKPLTKYDLFKFVEKFFTV